MKDTAVADVVDNGSCQWPAMRNMLSFKIHIKNPKKNIGWNFKNNNTEEWIKRKKHDISGGKKKKKRKEIKTMNFIGLSGAEQIKHWEN